MQSRLKSRAEEENHEGEHHLALGVARSCCSHRHPSYSGVEGGGSAGKNTGTVSVVVTVWGKSVCFNEDKKDGHLERSEVHPAWQGEK